MSSGIEATILYQFGDVVNLMQDKKKDPNLVSRALQGIISDDEINVRPKSGKANGVYRVQGSFRTLYEAIKACDCPYVEDFAKTPEQVPHVIQPVDCCVRALDIHKVRVSNMPNRYPKLVDPLSFFTFGALFPEERKPFTHYTFWRDPQGTLWLASLGIIATSMGQLRASICPVKDSDAEVLGFKESTVLEEGRVVVRD